MRKSTMWFPNRSETTRPVQLLKGLEGLGFKLSDLRRRGNALSEK